MRSHGRRSRRPVTVHAHASRYSPTLPTLPRLRRVSVATGADRTTTGGGSPSLGASGRVHSGDDSVDASLSAGEPSRVGVPARIAKEGGLHGVAWWDDQE